MKKIALFTVALSALLFAALPAWANKVYIHDKPAATDIHLTRNEAREFAVGANTKLSVNNKYGEIILHTWNESKVKIEVSVNAYGKTQELAESVLNRVAIDFNEFYGTVSSTTVFDRKTNNPVMDFIQSFGNDAKAILNRSKVEIDYDVYLPANLAIALENKFGDVYLGDLQGDTYVKLSHGALKSGKLLGSTRLYLNFANTDLQEVGELFVDSKGGSLDVGMALNADITTAASELEIGSLQEMNLVTRNDKVRIGSVKHLKGKAFFSKVQIMQLHGGIAMDANFGSIEVKELMPTFEDMSLTSTGTDIFIKVAKSTTFAVDITANSQNLVLPSQYATTLESAPVGERGQYTNRRGNIGGLPKGRMHINAKGGKIIVEQL